MNAMYWLDQRDAAGVAVHPEPRMNWMRLESAIGAGVFRCAESGNAINVISNGRVVATIRATGEPDATGKRPVTVACMATATAGGKR